MFLVLIAAMLLACLPVVLLDAFTLAAPWVRPPQRRSSPRCSEQPVALRALVSFRAPPALV